MKGAKEYILTLSCPDATGIVHAVSGLLYQAGCNIVDSQQFGDVAEDAAYVALLLRPDLHIAARWSARPQVDELERALRKALGGTA